MATKRLVPILRCALALIVAAGALWSQGGWAQSPGGWLRALPPDKQTDAIDKQLRGFDMAMFEVNYRYIEMYFAAIEGNWDYALYTGEKIGWAINNGFERRPKRRASGEAIFMRPGGPYPQVMEAIKKKDVALFKERFDALRAACNACHAAEKVAFIRVGIPTIRQTPVVNN
jgi:hypothetical protein